MRRLRSYPWAQWPRGLFIGLFCALAVAGFAQLGWLQGVENRVLDRLFQARGWRSPDSRITIIVADNATIARVKQWPLPRSVYAKIIQKLDQAGVRTIGFDVLFSEPSYSPSEDQLLAQACQKSRRVVQSAAFHVPLIYNPVVPVTLTSDKRVLSSRFAIKDLAANSRSAIWASSALPSLQQSAPAIGHINIHPELDGTLRRIPQIIRYRDHLYPSMALAAASHYLGLKPDDIVADDEMLRLVGQDGIVRHVPLNADGEAWVNWSGGNDTFPTYNFNQLLDGSVPPVALKDRLVLVGVTAAGAFEHRATPFSPVQPAIELQANAISDLLSNRPLRDVPLLLQLALLLLFSALVGVLSGPSRIIGATIYLILFLSALWLASVAALRLDWYLSPVAPALGALLTYSVVIASNYRREWESNWRADASVTALARGGALMASGRQRESLVDVISQTATEVLQAREVFLVFKDGSCFQIVASSTPHHSPCESLPALLEAAQRITQLGQIVLWNAGRASTPVRPQLSSDSKALPSPVAIAPAPPDPILRGVLEQLSAELALSHQQGQQPERLSSARHFNSAVAAPVGGKGATQPDQTDAEAHTDYIQAVLIAIGRRDSQPFTARDAVLLQTLAEQASLALDNLGYYEQLQGRVELANRNLRQAYNILSDERAQLAQERTKLAAAVESMESSLIITDEQDRVVFDNGMGAGFLWEQAPLLGHSLPQTLESYGLPELAALYQEKGSALRKTTIEFNRITEPTPNQPQGRRILVAQFTRLVAGDGNRLGSMLVVTDVTAERELEEMKSDFVSFVAHELRTPLTSITGFASLMRLNPLHVPVEQRTELLASIEAQCNRLNRMISDLLEVARLEPGHGIALRPAEFDLKALCDKVLQQLQVTVSPVQNMTLTMECPSPEVWVCLDPDRMEQVLLNLLSNAIKYSPDGGQVALTLIALDADKNLEPGVRLQVRDTGMGMTPEQLSHLFQKFYRTPDAQKRGITGTGLGLYLVKQLVESHGGSISVESEPGRGTIFTLMLPVETPA